MFNTLTAKVNAARNNITTSQAITAAVVVYTVGVVAATQIAKRLEENAELPTE